MSYRWINSGFPFTSLLFSLVLHALLVSILSIHTGYHRKISPLRAVDVKLVESPFEEGDSGKHGMEDKVNERNIKTLHDKKRDIVKRDIENKDAIIEESLHAIRSKKKIERIARLREKITISSSEKRQDSKRGEGSDIHSSQGDYRSTVQALIHSRWSYPEAIKEDLSCTVVFEIMMDGAVRILEIKGSGNRLFDYSAKNAILKSQPFPVPAEPTEVEVRFSR